MIALPRLTNSAGFLAPGVQLAFFSPIPLQLNSPFYESLYDRPVLTMSWLGFIYCEPIEPFGLRMWRCLGLSGWHPCPTHPNASGLPG